MLYSQTTDKIIKAYYKVYNALDYGFLEKVYEKALAIEIRKQGLNCVSQFPIKVHYDDSIVGEYFADILVGNQVIIELKAAETICKEHEIQLINYLRATNIKVGLLLNFGKKPEFSRKIFTK